MSDAHPRRPLWWRLYERVAMCIGLGSLALVCLTWLPFAAALHPLLPRPAGQKVGRLAIMTGFRIYLRILTGLCACRIDLSELDALRDEGSLIIAPNHPSLLDAVLVTSRLPNAVCVMKAGLMDNLLFGAGARLARYIRNDSAYHLVRRGCKTLQEGAQLVLFPEGTRTVDFPLNPLGHTVGLIAQRAKAPVQTVLLEFSTPYLGKRWPVWQPPVLPLVCRARLGRRFPPPADHKAFTRELETYFREALTSPAATSTTT